MLITCMVHAIRGRMMTAQGAEASLRSEGGALSSLSDVLTDTVTLRLWYTDPALTEYLNYVAVAWHEMHDDVRIRPELVNMNTGGAIVLLDGERVDIPENSEETLFPEAVLPGIRADRSGEDTVCILSACGLSSNDSPSVQIVYREEVLG